MHRPRLQPPYTSHTESTHMQVWKNNRDFTEAPRGEMRVMVTQQNPQQTTFNSSWDTQGCPGEPKPHQPRPPTSIFLHTATGLTSFSLLLSIIPALRFPTFYFATPYQQHNPWLHNQILQKAQLLVVPQLTEPCPPWRLFGHQFGDLSMTFSDLLLPSSSEWDIYQKYNVESSPRILMGEISPSPNICAHLLTEFLPWNIKSDGIYLSASLPDLCPSHQDIPIHSMSKPNDSWLSPSIRTRKDSPYKTASRITGCYLECHILLKETLDSSDPRKLVDRATQGRSPTMAWAWPDQVTNSYLFTQLSQSLHQKNHVPGSPGK